MYFKLQVMDIVDFVNVILVKLVLPLITKQCALKCHMDVSWAGSYHRTCRDCLIKPIKNVPRHF